MLNIRETLFKINFSKDENGKIEAIKVHRHLKDHGAKIIGNHKNKIKWHRKGRVEIGTLLEILAKISFNKNEVSNIKVSYKISYKD